MWYILNYIPISLASTRRKPEDWVRNYNLNNHSELELFAPTFFVEDRRKGHKGIRRKPLTFHYVFLKGEISQVKDFCKGRYGFSFVVTNKGEGKKEYATLTDREMEQFRKIALHYSNSLPFYPLENVDLEEGDLVRVVEGDFNGLEGYYFPKARSKYGRILLRMTQDIGTGIIEMNANYVQILQFSKSSKSKYHILERYLPKFKVIDEKDKNGLSLTEGEITELSLFVRRMCAVRMDQRAADIRLQNILMESARILGDETIRDLAAYRLEKLHKKNKPEKE